MNSRLFECPAIELVISIVGKCEDRNVCPHGLEGWEISQTVIKPSPSIQAEDRSACNSSEKWSLQRAQGAEGCKLRKNAEKPQAEWIAEDVDIYNLKLAYPCHSNFGFSSDFA